MASVEPRVVAQLGVRADWDDLVSAWGASPRAGIAWSPFGDDDTRVSGGYAISRDATRLHLFSRAGDQTPINTFYSQAARAPLALAA